MRPVLSSTLACVTVLAVPGFVAGQWTNRYPKVEGYGHHVYLEGYELPTLATGPMDVAPGPDGRRLAVTHRGWIWLVDLADGTARQLTRGGDVDSRPTWSPDGSRLAFIRDDGRDTWIVARDMATGAEEVVVQEPALDLDPTFGADGSMWYASAVEGTLDIWRLDPDTRERTRITLRRGIELRPQLAPSGDALVYLHKGGGDRILLRDLASGEERTVHEGQILSQLRPALSPSGDRVAFNVPRGHGDGWELRIASLERPGSSALLVGGNDRLPLSPAWSADGRWVYFSEADRNEVMRLFRVPAVGGPVEEVRVTAWIPAGERGRIRIRTHRAGASTPAAARLSVVGPEGHPFFPAGAQPRFDGQTGAVFFYSPGVVEMDVPAGEIRVEAVRGLATPPASGTVSVAPGGTAELDLALTPVWDARAAGWMSGDQHFHLNYGGPYRLQPGDLALQVEAEDLDVSTPLVANLHERLGEQRWFGWQSSGQAPLVRFGQEVRSHFLGHLGLIGTDELFWPWVWGPGYQVYGLDDRENAEATHHARAQGGLASYVHPAGADPFASPEAPGLPVALVADGILGDVDALELACLWTDELGTSELWYQLLNLGRPVAATAGSDMMANFYRTMAVGSTRTYVHTAGARDFDSYLQGLREGRSFVTTGPLLDVRVDGARPGSVVAADGEARVEFDVHTAVAVDRVEVVVNGAVAWTGGGVEAGRSRSYQAEVAIPEGGWVAVRAIGPAITSWPAMDSYAFAHSSPVWIGAVGSTDASAARRAAEQLLPALTGARLRLDAGYGGAEIPRLRARFDEARAQLDRWLAGERP